MGQVKTHEFKGEWETGNTGIYTIEYVPTKAGHHDLHVWCEPHRKAERVAFPGSPFTLHVTEGVASAHSSLVDGWSKLIKEDNKFGKDGKSGDPAEQTLTAGDTVSTRAQICDQ